MADHNLNTVFDLPGVPGFALGGIDARPQNSGANSLVPQDSLQSSGDVVFLRVHRKDLTPPSFRKLLLDLFDQLSFLGINAVLGKLTGFCNHESHLALEFRIELSAVERPDPVWVIGI